MRRRAREEAGREIGVTLQLAPLDPEGIEEFEKAGVHRTVWYLPSAGRDAVEKAFDRYAAAKDAYEGSP